MKRTHLILAWLLLLIPTVTIGVLSLRLLARERENLAMMARATAMQQAESAAQNIDLLIGDVKDGLTRSLRGTPMDEHLVDALYTWQQETPLIRNVFVVELPDRILLPNPDRPANQEEAEFLVRYDALFSGRVAWGNPAPDIPASQPRQPTRSGYRSSRENLWQATRQRAALQQGAQADFESLPQPGWFNWTWENRVHMLGWIDGGDYRFGIEVETIALISQLIGSLPEPGLGSGVLALLDGNGQVVHQRGEGIVDADTLKLATVQVGASLPHWQISIFAPQGTALQTGRRTMAVLSTLLVGSFVAAIMLGGSLLLWQAHRNLRDARQKTSFVSNVSHELKTPLTTIRMYAELLGEGRVKDERKRGRYLEVIVDESQRLTRLVNNVLDFSRLEQGRKQYHPEALDLAASIRDLLDTQSPRLDQAGFRLQANLPTHPVPVHMDRDTLEQVLLNLIDNAIKYAADGRELTLELEAPARLRVCDRGPGIPTAHRDRVFEQFHRVDDSLTASQPGSGLGLSIIRRQMRDLGGDILYQPRPGGGACFTVDFPTPPDS